MRGLSAALNPGNYALRSGLQVMGGGRGVAVLWLQNILAVNLFTAVPKAKFLDLSGGYKTILKQLGIVLVNRPLIVVIIDSKETVFLLKIGIGRQSNDSCNF